jgi:hypothetical protein
MPGVEAALRMEDGEHRYSGSRVQVQIQIGKPGDGREEGVTAGEESHCLA